MKKKKEKEKKEKKKKKKMMMRRRRHPSDGAGACRFCPMSPTFCLHTHSESEIESERARANGWVKGCRSFFFLPG